MYSGPRVIEIGVSKPHAALSTIYMIIEERNTSVCVDLWRTASILNLDLTFHGKILRNSENCTIQTKESAEK